MKIFNSSTKKLWLPIVLGAGLVGMIQSAYGEGTGSDSQVTNPAMESGQAIKQSPLLHEVYKNGNHYVTKDEQKAIRICSSISIKLMLEKTAGWKIII
ncbi:MAG: hypothetical protein ACXW0H_10820 [Methylobacter sp.]